jgi:uncharacterized HAD superfamily protein
MKKKIGVDFDEVLASLIEGLFDHHNKTRGTNLDKKDIKLTFISDYTGYSKEETSLFLDEFISSGAHSAIVPVAGAIEAIETLKDYELVIITIRPEHWRKETEAWLQKYFGDTFREVHMLGKESSSEGGVTQSKEDLSVGLGLSLFIEDSLSNAKKISAKGIPVILLDKPWNQEELPENIYRCTSWGDVLQIVKKLIP